VSSDNGGVGKQIRVGSDRFEAHRWTAGLELALEIETKHTSLDPHRLTISRTRLICLRSICDRAAIPFHYCGTLWWS